MTDLALSALTDVILACELYFLAGLAFRIDVERGSPAFIWAVYLTLTGTATMLGAVDLDRTEGEGGAGNVLVSLGSETDQREADLPAGEILPNCQVGVDHEREGERDNRPSENARRVRIDRPSARAGLVAVVHRGHEGKPCGGS